MSVSTPMSSSGTKTATAELLGKLFKNVKMGSESIIGLLPKVEDVKFKSDMTLQLNGYESFAAKINALLRDAGEKPEEESMMTKVSAKIGSTMNTLMDSSVSHLADMMIQGSTMGVTDTIKLLREFENTNASETALGLARDIIKFEEQNIERLKPYL